MDELAKVMEPLPQVLYNVEVREKRDLSDFPEIKKRTKEIEEILGNSGRILIRYSAVQAAVLCSTTARNLIPLRRLSIQNGHLRTNPPRHRSKR